MNKMSTTKLVVETLQYVKKFFGSQILIKLGGSILDDEALVKNLCEDLSLLRAAGIRIIIVHGGSKAISKTLKQYQIESRFHEGQRVTTPEMISLIEMVLCGHINPMLVRKLNTVGVAAVGLTGGDQKLLQCKRFSEELGEVGRVERVNHQLIERYLDTQKQNEPGIIPVIAPIGCDEHGNALNVNADWAASQIATAMNIHKLVYLTDQPGIYDADNQIIPEVDAAELNDLITRGVVKDGMLTKANTILQALNNGIDHIHIISAKKEHALIEELFTEKGIGTICTLRARTPAIEQV